MGLFDMFDWAKDLIARLGYFGIFLGSFLESIFPPIPSEILLGFSGFLVSEGRFVGFWVVFFAVLGNMLSVSLIWLLGKTYGRAFIIKFGKYAGVSEKEMNMGENLFQKYGYWVVFGCQVVPLARTMIAFPAGVLKTQYYKFIIANSLGASIWFSLLTYIGYSLGNNWGTIVDILKPFETVLFGLAILVVIAILVRFGFYVRSKMAGEKVVSSN
jgi:membrane protein DedA with SNARE-associated domain